MENRAIKKLYSMDEAVQDQISEKIIEVVSDSPVTESVQDRMLIEKIEDGVALVTDVESGDQAIADTTGDEVVFTEVEPKKEIFCEVGESCKLGDVDCVVDSEIDEDGNVTIKVGDETQVVEAAKLTFSHGMGAITEDNALVKMFIKMYNPAKEVLDKFISELKETAANLPKGGRSGKMFSTKKTFCHEGEEVKFDDKDAVVKSVDGDKVVITVGDEEVETTVDKLMFSEAEEEETEEAKEAALKAKEEADKAAELAGKAAEEAEEANDEVNKAKVDPSKEEEEEEEGSEKKTFSATGAAGAGESRISRFL